MRRGLNKTKGKGAGRRKGLPRKPKKPTTFEDVSTLSGSEYYQTDEGITFSIVDAHAMDNQIYGGELLAKFYHINMDTPPVAQQMIDNKSESIPTKTWYFVMRGGFHIRIEQGRETAGPHPTQLWFKPFTQGNKPVWLATLQLMVFFFNEEQVREELYKAMEAREFFMTERMRDTAIHP